MKNVPYIFPRELEEAQNVYDAIITTSILMEHKITHTCGDIEYPKETNDYFIYILKIQHKNAYIRCSIEHIKNEIININTSTQRKGEKEERKFCNDKSHYHVILADILNYL